jgi:hypothetical protein
MLAKTHIIGVDGALTVEMYIRRDAELPPVPNYIYQS